MIGQGIMFEKIVDKNTTELRKFERILKFLSDTSIEKSLSELN